MREAKPKKITTDPVPALVEVRAACGHYDRHWLGPGERLVVQGTFSVCDGCSGATGPQAENES